MRIPASKTGKDKVRFDIDGGCNIAYQTFGFESLSPIHTHKYDGIHRCIGGIGVNFSARRVKQIDVFHVQINESRIRRTNERVTPVDSAFIGANTIPASGRHELVSLANALTSANLRFVHVQCDDATELPVQELLY